MILTYYVLYDEPEDVVELLVDGILVVVVVAVPVTVVVPNEPIIECELPEAPVPALSDSAVTLHPPTSIARS